MMKLLAYMVFIPLLAGQVIAAPASVIRHKAVRSDTPVALAVEVPPGGTTVYVSGTLPTVPDTQANPDSSVALGNTQAQTVSVLQSIEKKLNGLGLGIRDIVRMQVFLVGDPEKEGAMDFSGFMAGYKQFFGTPQQPNLPSRTVVQVAGLARPQFLVEIEVTAIRP